MNEEIASNLTTWPPNISPGEVAARISAAEEGLAAGEAIEFAISRRSKRQLIGWISFFVESSGSRNATIGYWLGSEYQGQGFMTEAAEAALPFASSFLQAGKLVAHAYPWNTASIAVLRKFDFVVEGGISLYSPVRNRNEDAFVFSRSTRSQETFSQAQKLLEQ